MFCLNSIKTIQPKFILCLVIILLFLSQAYYSLAQVTDYVKASVDCQFSQPEKERQLLVTQRQLNQLKDSWRKEAAVLLKQRNEEIASLCTEKSIITDADFVVPIQRIFNHILSSNRLSPANLQLYLSKQPWPNAFSAGEGSLVFQIGLLPVLRNESELAFVLCHEIAHYILDHSLQSLTTYFQQMYSVETKEKLKQIEKQEYGSKTLATQLVEKLTFTSRRHSRFHENSADSLALVFLDAAGYNVQKGAESMISLDGADTTAGYVSLSKHFNFSNFPFQERWIKKTKTLGSSIKANLDINADSLKTHPDCSKRLDAMEQILQRNGWKGGNFSLLSPDTFEVLQRKAMFERVDTWFQNGQYDYALFEALRLTDLYPDHSFGYVQVGNILQEMCFAYGKFQLATYVHTPSVTLYSENFNELLRMLQRLSLEEMVKLTVAYVLHHGNKWESKSGSYKEMASKLQSLKKLLS